MSTPAIESVKHDGTPSWERHLPSAISRRIIFHLQPVEGAPPFTADNAVTFASALHGEEEGHADFLMRTTTEGNYVIDFPSTKPARAAERVAKVVFSAFGTDYANAELAEARIERTPDDLDGLEASDAWQQMDDATRLVRKIMEWKNNQLLSNAIEHVRYEVT